MVEVFESETYTFVQDELVRGIFGNKLLGNVDVRFSEPEDYVPNRAKAVSALVGAAAVTSSELVVMMPISEPGFIDLADVTDPQDLPKIDGLVTTNPNIILSGNPADCAMIAMYGIGKAEQKVLGLIHVGRNIAEKGGHLNAIRYLNDRYGLAPDDTRMIFPPSIKAASYMPGVRLGQHLEAGWQDYMYQDEAGSWHVDFLTKTIKELQAEGVSAANMYVSSIDVGAHPDYYSHRQHLDFGQPQGRNAVMFQLLNA